jgi:hypothetical protein
LLDSPVGLLQNRDRRSTKTEETDVTLSAMSPEDLPMTATPEQLEHYRALADEATNDEPEWLGTDDEFRAYADNWGDAR